MQQHVVLPVLFNVIFLDRVLIPQKLWRLCSSGHRRSHKTAIAVCRAAARHDPGKPAVQQQPRTQGRRAVVLLALAQTPTD
jgi:hypothetical protein